MNHVITAFISAHTVRQNIARVKSSLSEHALKKADRFVREEDRLLSLGGSFLIERLAGPVDKLKTGPNGKPYFEAGEGPFFNISHSVDLAGIIVSNSGEAGLDIEKIRPGFSDIRSYCLSGGELKSGEEFLKLFTAKEAIAKAAGCGLGDEIKKIPSLPEEGAVNYCNRLFHRHIIKKDGYYIFAAMEGGDFTVTEVEINEI